MNDPLVNDPTDVILAQDAHLVHSFADLHSLEAAGARTVITQAEGAYVFNPFAREFSRV